ncbi:MAG: hypothetical protein AB8H80_21875, partial [Planctomycetota bacterium]
MPNLRWRALAVGCDPGPGFDRAGAAGAAGDGVAVRGAGDRWQWRVLRRTVGGVGSGSDFARVSLVSE